MALAIDSFFHWNTFLSPCLHHWAFIQNQLYCVYIVSSFALAFVRILSYSALTLCHIHYGDSIIPGSPDFIMRTVSHYFVLSTLNIFLIEKGQTNGSRDTTRSKCLHQPKSLILLVILTSVWFSKNARALSIRISKRSKTSNVFWDLFSSLLHAIFHSFAFDEPLVQCFPD